MTRASRSGARAGSTGPGPIGPGADANGAGTPSSEATRTQLSHPRVLGAVYLSAAASTAAISLLLVALPFRSQQLGIPVVLYGVAAAANALGMLVTEGVWGAWAFRLGHRGTILSLGALVAGLCLAVALASSFLFLALSLAVFGMVVVYPIPLLRWFALTAHGPGTAGWGTGRFGLFFGIGIAVGAAAGPALFVTVGYLAVGLVAVGLSGVSTAALVSIPWRAIALPSAPPSSRAVHRARALFTLEFSLCLAAVVLYFMTYSLVSSFLQYYSVSLFGGTPTEAGLIIGGARATSFAAGWLLGRTVDRWGPAPSGLAGFALVAVGALGTGLSPDLGEMIAATMVLSIGGGWLSASLLPLALGPIPRPDQGMAVGIFGSFEDLGLLVGPIAIGWAYASLGARAVFPLVTGFALVGLLTVAGLLRSRRASEGGPSGPAPAPPPLPGAGPDPPEASPGRSRLPGRGVARPSGSPRRSRGRSRR